MKLYWFIFAIGTVLVITSWFLRQYNEWLFITVNLIGVFIWIVNAFYDKSKRGIE